MPERNLVTFVNAPWTWPLLTTLCCLLALQLGCAKVGTSSFRDLLNPSREIAAWRQSGEGDLERQFFEDPSTFETLNAETAVSQGQAEFASDENGLVKTDYVESDETKPVRLTATAPSKLHGGATDCQSGQCTGSCCNHRTKVPKLPYAEPIEPPAATASQVPPGAIVSQPLTPIVLKSPVRQDSGSTDNGLRDGNPFGGNRSAAIKSSWVSGGLRAAELSICRHRKSDPNR